MLYCVFRASPLDKVNTWKRPTRVSRPAITRMPAANSTLLEYGLSSPRAARVTFKQFVLRFDEAEEV